MAQIARRNLGGKESRKGRKQDMTFFFVETSKHLKMALIARRKPFKSVEVGLLMKILGVHWPEQVSSYIRGYIDTQEREREREDLERGTSFDF